MLDHLAREVMEDCDICGMKVVCDQVRKVMAQELGK